MKTKQFILVLLALFASVTAKAADNDVFTASSLEGVDMFFTIISEEDKTVQVGKYVVAANNYFPAIDDSYEGSITIPSKVTNNEKEYTVVRLGARAFHNCKKLTEVTLPNTINSESPYSAAFGNCESLTKVTIPEGVTVIGWQDYWGCTSLATISIPSTVTSIGSEAFYNTKWLNDQPDGLVYISNFLYTYKGEMPANTHIDVAEGTTTILGKAFYNCTNLTSITLPSTLTTIDNNSLTGFAFDGCTNLASVTLHTPTVSSWFKDMASITSVILDEEVENIANDAFDGCTNLASVTFQTPIVSSWFKDMTSITSVILGEEVENIANDAFNGCSSLTSVTVKNPTPVGISSNTFSNAANATLWVPNFEAYNAYRAANNWKDFKRVTGIIAFKEPKAETYCVGKWDTDNDGYLEFDEAAAVTYLYYQFNGNVVSYTDWSSFDEFEYFTGVKTIRSSFRYLRTASIKIPANVTKIGDTDQSNGSFDCCTIKKLEFMVGDETLTLGKAYAGYGETMFGGKSGCAIDTLIIGRNITAATTSVKPFEGTYNLVIITDNVSSLSQNFITSNKLITGNGTVDLSISCSIDSAYVGRPGTYYTKHGFITNNVSSIMLRNYSKTDNTNPLLTVDYLVAVDEIPSNAFRECSNLSSIVFHEGTETIQSIGDYAFSGCTSLTSLLVFSGLKTIGAYAFQNSGLTSIVLNEGLQSIGSNAFKDCSLLSSVTIPSTVNSIGDCAFQNSGLTSIVLNEGLQSIGSGAFKDCSLLSSITIPSTVNSIGNNSMPPNKYIHFSSTVPVPVFQISLPRVLFVPDDAVADYKTAWPDYSLYIVGESSFTEKVYSITAQESSSALLEAIGEENTLKVVKLKVSGTINSYDMMVMRNKMPNLRELDLSEVSIVANNYNYGTGVSQNNVFPDFLKTTALTSLILPNTITSIGNNAFNSTTLQLGTLTIPASVQSIGNYAFYKSTLETLTIPASVQSIGNSAFYKSTIDVRFVENSQLNSIGGYAFSGSSLESLKLDNVTIAANAFSSCSSLKTIEVNGGSIGRSAFASCNNLETIVVNSSLPSCDRASDGPFSDCGSLKNVTLGTDYIQRYTFYHCPIENLIITRGVIRDYAFADVEGYVGVKGINDNYTSTLKSVILQEGVTKIQARAFKVSYSPGVNVTLSLPESLTSIGDDAFSGWSGLKGELVIPRGITVIPGGAFYGCGVSSVKLSPNTTKICSNAFGNCTNIEEIRLPSTLTRIENGAFSGCSNLKTVYAYMPDVITIGNNTFPDYQMSKLYVPSFLYYTYYWDSNWSQFLQVLRCDLQPGDYETFYTNGDILFADGEERITTDTPIATIGSQGSITVEGEAQAFDTVDQTVDADYSASLIGDGEGDANNMPMNELRVNIAVTAGKWYFFCFPFDVTIASCTYPGRYAWRSYDGATRAANGSGGWKKVIAETLNAREGYAFQSETTGTLTVRFSAPTFGGNRTRELEVHSASNAQNASWNFVGNPYSSYYDFGTADITSPITVWTGSSYTAYRPGDDELHLRPYQAFFVQKPEAASSIQFNVERRESYRQSQRAAASRAFARSAENVKSNRMFLDIVISDNDTAALDRTRLVLNEKAQRSYELDCDAAKFMADNATAQVYMMEDGQPMAINERPVKGDIRLGYIAKNKGTLSIKAQRMDLPMLLVDLVTGTEFDLSNGDYEFSTEAGTFNKRFMLRLSGEATAIRNLANETGVTISKTKGGLNVAGAEGKTVEVYNVGGSLVSCQNNGFISLPTGIYLVKVNDKSTKISVK